MRAVRSVVMVSSLLLAACGDSTPGSDAGGGTDGAADGAVGGDSRADGPLSPDASAGDAAAPDRSVPDSSGRDAGRSDGTRSDASPPDARRTDALGTADRGAVADARPYPDAAPRRDTGPVSGCGNGVRDTTEQCDDGNTRNLDGCDATCHFEQVHRINYLLMQWGTDSFCPSNAFGAAFVLALAQQQVQQSMDDGIRLGGLNLLYKMMGLDDLSGTNDPSVELGVMNALYYGGTGYDGTKDLDWWYQPRAASYDAQRNPLYRLVGKIGAAGAHVLEAGPGFIQAVLPIVGTSGTLDMPSSRLRVTLGASSTPVAWTAGNVGHVPAEHLSPTLTSFATAGETTPTGSGQLCGSITAASLSRIPAPPGLLSGFTKCGENYTASNSLLDLVVGGCTVVILQAIRPTQPDGENPGAPVAGAGAPYRLTVNAQKQVTGCRDKNNATVTLSACLADATYSSYLRFASGRVIAK